MHPVEQGLQYHVLHLIAWRLCLQLDSMDILCRAWWMYALLQQSHSMNSQTGGWIFAWPWGVTQQTPFTTHTPVVMRRDEYTYPSGVKLLHNKPYCCLLLTGLRTSKHRPWTWPQHCSACVLNTHPTDQGCLIVILPYSVHWPQPEGLFHLPTAKSYTLGLKLDWKTGLSPKFLRQGESNSSSCLKIEWNQLGSLVGQVFSHSTNVKVNTIWSINRP